MNGFICVLKPPGITSAGVVARLKKHFKGLKLGHGGTLDPQAAGVLPIMIGKATRLFEYLQLGDKQYISEIYFGKSTDTQDSYGKVLETATKPLPSKEEIFKTLDSFIGEIEQIPPSYSAIKINGQRAYNIARRTNQQVILPKRKVNIFDIKPTWFKAPNLQGIAISCSKGTYIRTLCHDIGRALNCPAHMSFLLRTKSGIFTLEDSYSMEDIERAFQKDNLSDLILPIDYPIMNLPKIFLPENQIDNYRYGRPMNLEDFDLLDADNVYRLYNKQSKTLLSLVRAKNSLLSIVRYFNGLDD